jgi:hypothetical protein
MIVDSANVAIALVEPATNANLIVDPDVSAIAKATVDSWIATHGDLDAVCAHFGWTNSTGANPDDGS